MNQKIMGILTALKDEHEFDSKKTDENNFELITNLSEFGDRTFITFEIRKQKDQPGPGDILTIEVRHWVGWLENLNPELLLYLLTKNGRSFWDSSSYASIKHTEDGPIIFLNSYHHFNFGWPDKEIAEMISIVILDISNSLMLVDKNAPHGIRFFGNK